MTVAELMEILSKEHPRCEVVIVNTPRNYVHRPVEKVTAMNLGCADIEAGWELKVVIFGDAPRFDDPAWTGDAAAYEFPKVNA